MSLMKGERYGFDKHPHLIAMYKELQNGWIPPMNVSEEEYIKAKQGELESHLTGFIGFGCSFSGKWFGGYARNDRGRNYSTNAHNSILRKFKTLSDVQYTCVDYKEINPIGALIYCDPPYANTTGYGKVVGEFNSIEFWNKAREWSKDNIVIVSEYNAPDDFIEVWRKETKTEIRNKDNKREPRIEKLFIYKETL